MEPAMKQYTERALQGYIKSHSKWGPKKREERLCFFALALCGESGELANFVKKAWRQDYGSIKKGFEKLKPKMISEAADVGAYAMMFLDLLSGGKRGLGEVHGG
jgi:NTP pyrophosphatase (non-canonical NTP hydrolase)